MKIGNFADVTKKLSLGYEKEDKGFGVMFYFKKDVEICNLL
jgi:hypothetical protein